MQRTVGVLGDVQPIALIQLEPADEFLRQDQTSRISDALDFELHGMGSRALSAFNARTTRLS
jgi:hypothetical protein